MIRAISLDLDDTLWPIEPVITRAESILQAWMAEHASELSSAWPLDAMRALRQKTYDDNPHLWHDFSLLRRMSLSTVFADHHQRDELVDRAYAAFIAERNRVDFYADALDALDSLKVQFPLLTISNGNADLDVIGIGHMFQSKVYSRQVGFAKPHPRIFQHAAEQMNIATENIAHIGDDPEMDVIGAQAAGMIGIWLNRGEKVWPYPQQKPDAQISSLTELPHVIQALSIR